MHSQLENEFVSGIQFSLLNATVVRTRRDDFSLMKKIYKKRYYLVKKTRLNISPKISKIPVLKCFDGTFM